WGCEREGPPDLRRPPERGGSTGERFGTRSIWPKWRPGYLERPPAAAGSEDAVSGGVAPWVRTRIPTRRFASSRVAASGDAGDVARRGPPLTGSAGSIRRGRSPRRWPLRLTGPSPRGVTRNP